MDPSFHSSLGNSLPLHRPVVRSRFRPFQPWGLVLTCVGALVAFVPTLRALDPGKTIFQFNCHNWTREAGLPADKISAIAQTPDGYLWLGSQNGLIRFDGLEFKVFPIALPEAQGQDVRTLDLAADGELWFAVARGGYGHFDGEKFSAIGDPRWTAPSTYANAIHAGRDGAIWTGSVSGWGRWMPGKPDQTYFDTLLGTVMVFTEDPAGQIWMGTAERGLFHWVGDKFEQFPDEGLKKENIHALATDAEGNLWVGTGRGLRHYDAQYRLKKIYLPTEETTALLVDSHGILWAGTSKMGLVRIENDEITVLRKADGLGSDSITSLFEDREGSLWIGTLDGLSQLTDLKFPIYSAKEGLLPGEALTVAASPKGGLWISLSTGAAYFDGKTFRNYSDDWLLPNHYVRRIFEAKNGDVYLADGDKNLNVLAGDRLAVRYLNNSWPEAFAEDAEGLIGGIGPNLVRFHDGKIQPFVFRGTEPLLDWVNHLFVAKDGALLVATNSGLFRIKDGKFEHWSAAGGLSADRIHYVFEDEDGSIWIGMPTGMARIKDHRINNITVEDGLPDGRIYAFVPGSQGFFWVSSGRGIFRVSRESLNAFADGKAPRVHCDIFDGLESVKFTDRTEQGYSVAKTLDGRIWFPNPRGVVMIDPAHFFTNRIAPLVHLQKVYVDGKELKGKDSAILDAGNRRVEFFFTALSYVAPKKNHVIYQLAGFDPGWIEAGEHRSAVYSNLKPGRYVFAVKAANVDGVWNTVGASYGIALPTPFHETVWFYGLCGLATLGLLAGGYRWKVRQLHAHQQKLQAEKDQLELKVAERTKELARSLSLLNATIESATDGIVVVDLAGRVIFHNTTFAALWQFPPGLLKLGDAEKLRAHTAGQLKDPAGFLRQIAAHNGAAGASVFDLFELKDGRIFERYLYSQRIGQVRVGSVISWRDVTARTRSEMELRSKTALLEAQQDSSFDGILVVGNDGKKIFQNQRLIELWKLPPDIAAESDDEKQMQFVVARTKHPGQFVEKVRYLYSHPNESSRDEIEFEDGTVLDRTSAPVIGKDGKHYGRIWGFRDISDRKRAEKALRETEVRLAHAMGLAQLFAWEYDVPSARFIFSNRYYALHGTTVEREGGDQMSAGDFVRKFVHPDDAHLITEEVGKAIATSDPNYRAQLECRVFRRDRELRYVLVNIAVTKDAAGRTIQLHGANQDITERKRSEAALQESEARFRVIFNKSPLGIALVDLEGRPFLTNAACQKMIGRTAEELRGMVFTEFTHPEDRDKDMDLYRELIAGERDSYQIDKRYIRKDSQLVWTSLSVTLIRDPAGRPQFALALVEDITERRQAVNALRESNEKFHQLADNITDAFWIRSPDMREVQYVSPAFERIWGRSVESLYANPQLWADFILPQDRERVVGAFAALKGDAASLDIEYRIVRPEGEVRWIRVRGFQVRDNTAKLTRHIGVVTDITERKQSEAELATAHRKLLETSRQAGMAEVATGVLHNVGNVLNSVNVSVTLVADHVGQGKAGNIAKVAALLNEHHADLAGFLTTDPRGQMIPAYLATLANELANEQTAIIAEVDDLRKNVAHIKDIVAMQQTHAGSSGVIETVAVPDLIEEALRINADSLARHSIRTIRDYRARPTVTTDRHKVMQILINLLRNAKQACNESGRPDKQIRVSIATDDRAVSIAIIDNGVGIPAENLTQIFNHGFTTKQTGHGFGLHNSALAVKELGGALHVESAGPGRGATFTLDLPLQPNPPANENPRS